MTRSRRRSAAPRHPAPASAGGRSRGGAAGPGRARRAGARRPPRRSRNQARPAGAPRARRDTASAHAASSTPGPRRVLCLRNARVLTPPLTQTRSACRRRPPHAGRGPVPPHVEAPGGRRRRQQQPRGGRRRRRGGAGGAGGGTGAGAGAPARRRHMRVLSGPPRDGAAPRGPRPLPVEVPCPPTRAPAFALLPTPPAEPRGRRRRLRDGAAPSRRSLITRSRGSRRRRPPCTSNATENIAVELLIRIRSEDVRDPAAALSEARPR